MTADKIITYCLERLEGIAIVNSWGERGVFYNPENRLKRGVYILTLKEKDGENDSASQLNRKGIYRVNIGVRKSTFEKTFGAVPARPPKGGTADMGYDYTVTDRILPHPVYGWMSWICCLNPSEETFERLKPLIAEAYEYAKEKFLKRK